MSTLAKARMHSRTRIVRRRLSSLLLVCAALFAACSARAQVVPSAYRGPDTLWVGASYQNFDASFPYQSGSRLSGAGAFVDFFWNAHLGVEGTARFLRFGGYADETESSYLGGPVYRVRPVGRLRPFVRALIGNGRIHYPYDIGDAGYFAVAPAAGASWRLSANLSVRGAYEYQYWLNSPGYSNQPSHALHPNGVEVGIAYRIFR